MNSFSHNYPLRPEGEQLTIMSYTKPAHVIINPSTANHVSILEDAKVIGFDIETTISKPRDGFIRLYQCYIPEKDTVFIWDTYPVFNPTTASFKTLLNLLKDKEVEVRIHNSLFEQSWIMEKHRIRISNVLDTMLLNAVKNAGLFSAYQVRYKEPNSLGTLSELYNMNLDKTHQGYDYSLAEAIPEDVYEYAANDAKACWYLGEVIERPKQDVDLRAAEVFAQLNYNGLPVNMDKLEAMAKQYKEQAEELYKEIERVTGCNPNSPKQLLPWIINHYGAAPVGFHRKKKIVEACTKKSALNDFIYKLAQTNVDTKILKLIQDYRTIKKCADYPKEYMEACHNGRMHSSYKVLGYQGEGRSSCARPNSQNIPKPTATTKKYGLPAIRSVFEAVKGWVLIEIDLAAAHAQIARFISRDSKLIESRKTGVKLHFYTLQNILKNMGIYMTPIEIRDAKKDEFHEHYELINAIYKLSKNTFYSFLNFSGAPTLQDTFSKEDVIIDTDTCKEYLTATASTFSGLRKFQLELIKKVEKRYSPKYAPNGDFLGKVAYLTMPDGSLIMFPKDSTTASKICAAVWLRVEASAIKQSLISTQELFDTQYQGQAEIVNFSHDSVLLHVREEKALEVAETVYQYVNADIRRYVLDYETEEELHYSSWLPGMKPKKDEKINKSGWSYLGFELKYNWAG